MQGKKDESGRKAILKLTGEELYCLLDTVIDKFVRDSEALCNILAFHAVNTVKSESFTIGRRQTFQGLTNTAPQILKHKRLIRHQFVHILTETFVSPPHGILQPGQPAPAHQADLLPGQMVLEDIHKDGILDDKDKISYGNNAPKIIYGFSNTFNYKRFDLNIYFYGEAGRMVTSSYWENWIDTNQNSQNLSRYVYKSFSSENKNSKNPSILASSLGLSITF